MRIRFGSVGYFSPSFEASFWVIRAQTKDGDWIYHKKKIYDPHLAETTCKEIAMAGEIDERHWKNDYPRSDWES